MIRLLSSRLMCHGNWYKGHGKEWSYLWAFSPTRDPLLFQKIPCHLVALLKDNAILTSHSSLGLFYCVYPLLTRDQFVCIITHFILLYLVFELNIKVFLKQAKPFAELILLIVTSVQCWHTYHKSYITFTDPLFLLGSKYNINNYHPWLY